MVPLGVSRPKMREYVCIYHHNETFSLDTKNDSFYCGRTAFTSTSKYLKIHRVRFLLFQLNSIGRNSFSLLSTQNQWNSSEISNEPSRVLLYLISRTRVLIPLRQYQGPWLLAITLFLHLCNTDISNILLTVFNPIWIDFFSRFILSVFSFTVIEFSGFVLHVGFIQTFWPNRYSN